MESALDIGIVGYGIAGIAAAIHLGRLGHRIARFDRGPGPATESAGMVLHPPAQRQLRQLGLLEEAMDYGARINSIRAQTTEGMSILDLRYGDYSPIGFGLGIGRAILHRILANADAGRDNVWWNSEIASIDPRQGVLQESSGTRHGPFDLVVVADGAHSKLRHIVPLAVRHDRIADSAALVGLVPDPHGESGNQLAQYFQGNRHVSLWPVGQAAADHARSCAFAMNVSSTEAKTLGGEGRWQGLAETLCPLLGRLIDRAAENPRVAVFSYRDTELLQLAVGKAVVVGDAGHSMSPQLGNGAQLALEDASVLADCISSHTTLDAALRRYSETRLPRLRRLHWASRWLTPYFQSNSRSLALIRSSLLSNALRWPAARQFAQLILD